MTRYLIIAAFAVGLLGAIYAKGSMDGREMAEARHSALIAAAQAEQLTKTKEMMRYVDALAQDFDAETAVLAANADRLAAANRGLRQALANRASGDTTTASGGDGGPVARALEQCADRYSELAGIADGYANQLIALQGWAKVVAPRE